MSIKTYILNKPNTVYVNKKKTSKSNGGKKVNSLFIYWHIYFFIYLVMFLIKYVWQSQCCCFFMWNNVHQLITYNKTINVF